MATKSKAPKRDASGWVKASAFRLTPETLARLDRLAAARAGRAKVRHTRTDVLRQLVDEEFAREFPGEKTS